MRSARGPSDGAHLIRRTIAAGDVLDARKARLDQVIEDVGTKTLKLSFGLIASLVKMLNLSATILLRL
jgi:hypothetical protein